MFIDEAQITLKGGHGGPGRASFYKVVQRGPDGGNGGRGGDVYIKATSDLSALNRFTKVKLLAAKDGEPGGSNKKSGKDGEDLSLCLPFGTILTDIATSEELELSELSQEILVCKGGKGGKGNFELRSPTNTTPMRAQPGLNGRQRSFNLKLKFIADFGLIGLPNAGKSSLLNELTRTNVKVANYPFTTLEANLGVFQGKIIADIPGLIEGAAEGKGLGVKFLKHIEKVSVIFHCLSSESEDVNKDYQVVRNELKKFNQELLSKKETILLTKSDLVSEQELKRKIKALRKLKKTILPISIYDYEGIEKLKKLLS